MNVTVSLPSLLAGCTGGARDVEVEASTLEGALEALLAGYPLLRPHLLDDRGALREHVNLFLNDQNARWIDDWSHALRPGDTLTVVQAVSGGSVAAPTPPPAPPPVPPPARRSARPAPPPVDTPLQRRNRWLAALAVAVCYGASGFLITGDSNKAFSVGLLVMAIFAGVLLFLPNRMTSGKPISAYYVAGLGVLLSPILYLALGRERTPWDDLEARYATERRAPPGLDAGSEVVLMQPVDELMVRPRSYKRATTSFSDQGVHLALSWPLSMVYDPVWVPVEAISHCRPSGVDTMYTSLEARGVAARIEVVDAGEDVLRWCRERGIAGQERTRGLGR